MWTRMGPGRPPIRHPERMVWVVQPPPSVIRPDGYRWIKDPIRQPSLTSALNESVY